MQTQFLRSGQDGSQDVLPIARRRSSPRCKCAQAGTNTLALGFPGFWLGTFLASGGALKDSLLQSRGNPQGVTVDREGVSLQADNEI